MTPGHGIPGRRTSELLPPQPISPAMSSLPAGAPHYSMLPVFRSQRGTLLVQFTYVTQHFILHNVQQLLEECCFDFALRHAPGFLVMTGWATPEAGEITEWSKRFPDYANDKRIESVAWNKSIAKALRSVCQLRHIAVHRRPINPVQLEELLNSSVNLSELLRDEKRTAHLREVLRHFTDFKRTVERHVHAAEEILDRDVYDMQRRIDDFNRQVWELTRKAGTVISDARRENNGVVGVAEKHMRDRILGLFERIKEDKCVKEGNNVINEGVYVKEGMSGNQSGLGIAHQNPQPRPIVGRRVEIIDLTGDDDIILPRQKDLGYRTIVDLSTPPSQPTGLSPNWQQSQSNEMAPAATGTKRDAPESNEALEGSSKKQKLDLTPESEHSAAMELEDEEMGEGITPGAKDNTALESGADANVKSQEEN